MTITVRVTCLPVCESDAHPYLTHFQIDTPRQERVRTVRLRCETSDTIGAVRAKLSEVIGEDVEMLRRGGTKEGIVLDDARTLEECGIDRDMGVWEHVWVDSEARRARAKADKEKMLSYINVSPNEMTPKVIRALRDLDMWKA